MATLLDALDQENLDNQREVVKNEKRQSYDNRPYGSFYEKLMAAVFPADHPYHHTPIGSMEDLDAASARGRRRRSSGPGTRPTTRCCRSSATWTRKRRSRRPSAASGPSRPTRPSSAARARGRARRHRPARSARSCPTTCRWCASTSASAARPTAPTSSTRSRWPRQILAGGRGTRLYRRLVRESAIAQDVAAFGLPLVGGGSIFGRLGHGPTGERRRDRGAAVPRGARSGWPTEPVTDDELARARALIESSELGALGRVEEVADRLSQFATLFDRPELINEQLPRYLAVTAEHIRDAAAGFPRRQPRRPDLRARRLRRVGRVGGGGGMTDQHEDARPDHEKELPEAGFMTDHARRRHRRGRAA